ncbi:hypothetical protein P6B95_09320 [Streptomyces atratus]|uniref:hypothetical protein n=1 Tax=Streptomyces atratus TaxID=1893 RepID=UPI00166F899F|nr:hypothetical protein [Streptomyces atratus]WPW33774.1 hypothetical protein P6B95_09320 [Streptomyces atratus]GGT80359.1 hypothetical protein GCM10010207_88590 [Streptomyces atratus]
MLTRLPLPPLRLPRVLGVDDVALKRRHCYATSLLPFFDNGDHLHPNDKGMQAVVDAVDLKSVDCASAPN